MVEVSIIMSMYNAQEKIVAALNSMTQQTFSDFEMIVIDDGSSDGSRSIVKRMDDPRIRLVTDDQNLGLPTRLNQGISLASGRFIARMDADDVSAPDRLAKQIEFLRRNPNVDLCGTWARSSTSGATIRFPTSHEEIAATLFLNSTFCHPSVMWRNDGDANKELLYNPEFRYAQDYDLWQRASSSLKMANLPEALIIYDDADITPSSPKVKSQRDLAWKVQFRQLRALGKWSDEEIQMHRRAVQIGWPAEQKAIRDLIAWLEIVAERNRQLRVLPHPQLSKVLAMHALFNVLSCARHGTSALRWYEKSSLSEHFRVSTYSRLKWLLFNTKNRVRGVDRSVSNLS